ncbi:3-keto-disaccharide hydrolase [Pedobacter sp. AW31-3R]|uniref:3-keto-disaccharide hydrolase n=1 Tax=Pedobacter sp. AW31-3R TaxID=3445781 RepID=UPI003FA01DAB
MKRLFINFSAFSILLSLLSLSPAREWTPLLDKNLSKWETYLSYAHREDYNGNIPKDASGSPIAPLGYNKDPQQVFSVLNEPEGPVLRISGETYGCIFTRSSFKNYHLKLQVKWGTQKYTPRKNKLKDSGILYHSNGEAGAEYWRSWMLSQEFQVMEGHMGDFWCQADGMIDIRSFPSEGMMNNVADETQPFVTFKKGGDFFCMRSENHELPSNEWNTLELICYEGKSLHIVNGHVVMVLKNSRYKDPAGKEITMDSGKIQLQSEGAEVFYKNILIQPLPAMPAEYTELFK